MGTRGREGVSAGAKAHTAAGHKRDSTAAPLPSRHPPTNLSGAVQLRKAGGMHKQQAAVGEQCHAAVGQHKVLLVRVCREMKTRGAEGSISESRCRGGEKRMGRGDYSQVAGKV